MESTEKELEKISKINSAGLINLRINNLWEDTHQHSRNAEFSNWNADLDRLWCELGADVKPNDGNDKEFTKINGKLSKLSPLNNWSTQKGFKGLNKDALKKLNSQYHLLMRKELFLRRLQNVQGKGTAYQEEEDWD